MLADVRRVEGSRGTGIPYFGRYGDASMQMLGLSFPIL